MDCNNLNYGEALLIKIILFAAFCGAVAWSFHDFGFEPVICALSALGAFAGLFVRDALAKRKRARQNQNVENGSVGIQAGRDIKGKIDIKAK